MAVKIALAGNPNCGKTTLFNALTGSSQFTGNWPGVTVEKKEGRLKGHRDVIITDLPGIYSLSPYTLEEIVAENYLITERPDVIINIVDGTNIERNLYLTTQLLELGIPVIVAVNMADILEKTGDQIHTDRLGAHLGCQVTEISALKGTGIQSVADQAVALAGKKRPAVCVHEFSPEAERIIKSAAEKLGPEVAEEQRRFFAIRLLEKDQQISQRLSVVPDVSDEIKALEEAFDDDVESIITNERYQYLSTVTSVCCTKSKKEKLSVSDRIDRIVTNRWLALPVFAAVMFLVYYISVTTVGDRVTNWANDGVFGDGWSLAGLEIPGVPVFVDDLLQTMGCADWLRGLIVDGIVAGVGAVLGFVPQMLVLFIFLAFLEGCGYMARVAFIMDRIFRKSGLSGKSFIPMLISSGCGVPGIMASRTIESDRDRRMTIMTTTFIPCGAKLPVIALIAGSVFNNAAWVSVSCYFVGIGAVICSGVILKKTRMFAGDPAPFVMELPAYHMPSAGSVLRSMWERGFSFIKKAGTIILLSTIVIWFLMSFGWKDGSFGMLEAEELNYSILSAAGSLVAGIFAPLGWGNWKMAVAVVSGLVAKENVVGTFGLLYGFAEVAEDGAEIYGRLAAELTPVAAYSFLIFNMLCAPCFAAMGAIKREMNSIRWFWTAIGYQCGLAYVVSLCIYQLGMLFTTGAFGVLTVVAVVLVAVFIWLLIRPYKENTAAQISGKMPAGTV